jgi:hypothetical protein
MKTEEQRIESKRLAQKRWKEKNKEKVRADNLKWHNDKYANDPEYRALMSERQKVWKANDPDHAAEVARESAKRLRLNPGYAERERQYHKEYSFNNKDGVSARNKLNYAVRKGRIIKPTKCSKCGVTACKIEGHHHRGYYYPLDVIWLCTSCHCKIRF